MISNTKGKLITILINVLVWGLLIFVLFMYPLLTGTAIRLPNAFWVKQGIHILLLIFTYYVNTYYLVTRLLLKNKPVIFIGILITWCFAASLFLNLLDQWLNIFKTHQQAFGGNMHTFLHVDFFGLMTMFFTFCISTGVSLVQHWHRDAKARQDFESLRTSTELSFLKAQINPHFFFNTLNTIYALTYVNVETSRESLYKLSHMMRYLLYETQLDKVSLSKEVDFIKDYIGIMRLRLRDNTGVVFDVPRNLQEMPIAPMLLLPFIENAFKHGVDDAAESTINVAIKQDDTGITLTVINGIFSRSVYGERETGERGIGLINTRRRLDLLYPGKYVLNINADVLKAKHELTLQLFLA
jgi:two-component system, LytTR family, sensor kinase